MNASTSQAYGDDALELDEAFLQRVDRTMLLSKQRDPFRLGQVARAAEEEARIAHMTGTHGTERKQMNTPCAVPRGRENDLSR